MKQSIGLSPLVEAVTYEVALLVKGGKMITVSAIQNGIKQRVKDGYYLPRLAEAVPTSLNPILLDLQTKPLPDIGTEPPVLEGSARALGQMKPAAPTSASPVSRKASHSQSPNTKSIIPKSTQSAARVLTKKEFKIFTTALTAEREEALKHQKFLKPEEMLAKLKEGVGVKGKNYPTWFNQLEIPFVQSNLTRLNNGRPLSMKKSRKGAGRRRDPIFKLAPKAASTSNL